MASQDPIPRSDAEFHTFQTNVIATMTTKATAWGIPAATLTALTPKQAAWNTAYGKVLKKGTFTSQDVVTKNEMREAFEAALRPVVQQWIQKNPVVTDADRTGMGLKPLDGSRTRTSVPTTVPVLKVKPGVGNALEVGYMTDTGSRARPEGVARCVLAYKVGEPAPSKVEDCNQYKSASRTPIVLTFGSDQAGQRVYVYAQWENTRSEGGPWTAMPASGIIPG